MEAFEDSYPGPAANRGSRFFFLFYSAWRTRRAAEVFVRDLRAMNVGQASFQEVESFRQRYSSYVLRLSRPEQTTDAQPGRVLVLRGVR